MREPPVMRRDFQRLAELRAEEARKQQGAYYLAGYAVECALKACIAKQTRKHEFPPKHEYIRDIYTHNLSRLLQQSGLEIQLENEMKANPALANNWNVVKPWSEDARYKVSGLKGNDMYMALMGPNGVLTWLRKHW
jgi:hypothetical protein